MAHTDFERMVVEELKSIETGATEPIAYINANHYTQHNLGVVSRRDGKATEAADGHEAKVPVGGGG